MTVITLLEPLILYFVLFIPGLGAGNAPTEIISFVTGRELSRIVVFNIPALALIWYLLRLNPPGQALKLKPGLWDLRSLAFALPGLLAIGIIISLVSSLLNPTAAAPAVEAPNNLLQWLVMLLSCITTGYLEESYFRYYLSVRFAGTGVPPWVGVLVSVFLFSFCHIYEGFWGALNAAAAGTLLSVIFMKEKSLHGIALAHGVYNALVYAIGV
jgi:membrane protease YdiL (CAAX protease family)